MTKKEKYNLFGKLAETLFSQNMTITYKALNKILKDNDAEYKSNRGLASAVSASYKYWNKKDSTISNAIAHTYTKKNGKLAWK